MDIVINTLSDLGPSRSSAVVDVLKRTYGLTDVAARQRLSRAHSPVMKFPIQLLPNRESFVYLKDQRSTERFWVKFHAAMRDTKSIHAAAIDGLINRGGIVRVDEFPVISGAPVALRKQVTASQVASRLEASGVIKKFVEEDIEYYSLERSELGFANINTYRVRQLTDGVILDAVREWARKLGLASYHKIAIRGESRSRQVGSCTWDLTGPSYLLPLRTSKMQMGFLVADVFSEGILEEHSIQYFIKKAQLLRSSLKDTNVLSMLVAEGFSSAALKAGHNAGMIFATTENLFGSRVSLAIKSLLYTLKDAAATIIGNPSKIVTLLNDLSQIEGAAGNLRGILFELISAYLAKDGAVSIDIGRTAINYKTGKKADIDILKVINKAECVGIECKGKNPNGMVTLDEIEDWIARLPTFKAFLGNQEQFREAKISFELWTSGGFQDDALALLEKEKAKRVINQISWKDGNAVMQIARRNKEKTIADALNQHFFKHPLSL